MAQVVRFHDTLDTGLFPLCEFAGEPGSETTLFTDAVHNFPEDDLENVLSADALIDALDSGFGIVETCLDRWTVDMLLGPQPGLGDPAGLQPRRLALRRAERDFGR